MWHVTCDMWHVTCDMWHVTCDMWHVTCDTWHVTCDMWQVTCDMWHVAHCTVQNLLNREWLRYSGFILAWSKSWYNPSKCSQQLQDIGQISRELTRASLKSNHFSRADTPNAVKNRHVNCQGWKLRPILSAVKMNKFSDFDQLRYSCLNIGHVFGCWLISRIFLYLPFLLCILTRYLPMCTQKLVTLDLKLYPQHCFKNMVVLWCCSGHKFLHCALREVKILSKLRSLGKA